VRSVRLDDAGQLAELETEARDALVDARGGASLLEEQPAVGDWVALMPLPEMHTWVAVIDGVVVGYLVLRHAAGDPTGIVDQVYVQPEAREIGFGDVMLAAAICCIRDGGGMRVESFALPGDRDTKNLYERAGVTARKIIVSKRIDG